MCKQVEREAGRQVGTLEGRQVSRLEGRQVDGQVGREAGKLCRHMAESGTSWALRLLPRAAKASGREGHSSGPRTDVWRGLRLAGGGSGEGAGGGGEGGALSRAFRAADEAGGGGVCPPSYRERPSK